MMQHKDLEKSWLNETIGYQMANIGSEVSRAIKNRNKPTRFQGAFDRALELFDLTILSLQKNIWRLWTHQLIQTIIHKPTHPSLQVQY